MEFSHSTFFSLLTILLLLQNILIVDSRYHYHRIGKKQKTKTPPAYAPAPEDHSPASPPTPPAYAPAPEDHSPASPPTFPSDPIYAPPPPETPAGNDTTSCIFNVTDFGAVGDGDSDDTAAFRSAWKEACQVENGVVLAPSDLSFTITSTIFSGPCLPGLTFQIDGVLMPPDGPDCWPETDSDKQWLVFYRLDDMTFTGTGTIEGNGQKWWDLPCKPHKGPNGSTLPGPCNSPALIRFFMSSNLVVSGLRIQNSPQFHMKFDGCEGVLIDKLSISSPKLSPNTDGIHIENTRAVGIYNSVIANGDDCISIGTGCSDVDIDAVTCGPSHGIRESGRAQFTRVCVKHNRTQRGYKGFGQRAEDQDMAGRDGVGIRHILREHSDGKRAELRNN
ncbi:hypothetical protein ACS0TY_027163 [Phlomoides rotata]